ncbi:MAG: glycosyltransferase family 4 protein [Bacteroidetes bacterium]|nr:glycosyltransferase family 4 protein [Bacteroidota bacterium]
MPEVKKGIFIISCLLEPPFGGIAKYLSFSLPKIADEIPIYGITQREYQNFGNKEVDLPNFKTKLIKNKFYGLVALPFMLFRHFNFVNQLLFKYNVPFIEVIKLIYLWFPEIDNYLHEIKDKVKYIHVYNKPYADGAVGMYLSKKYNIPLLLTTFGELVPHKDEIERIDEYSMQFNKITKDVLAFATKISSPTKYCQSVIDEFKISKEKIHLTYHVCDIDKFNNNANNFSTILEKHPQLKGKRCILFVGQMMRRKAPDLILQAAKNIKDLDKDIMFVFVGPDYGFYDELKSIAREAHLENQCLFPGAVSESDLFEFYSLADIFIFTTISKIECLGLVFVQAMLSDCAVIASNISGVPEVITSGENGLLFEPGDVNELTGHLNNLLHDDILKNKLKTNAKETVMKQFDEKIVLQQINHFYH